MGVGFQLLSPGVMALTLGGQLSLAWRVHDGGMKFVGVDLDTFSNYVSIGEDHSRGEFLADPLQLISQLLLNYREVPLVPVDFGLLGPDGVEEEDS